MRSASHAGHAGKVRVKALVAVMTGFGKKYAERREHSRQTWFPATQQELDRLEDETGMHLRFAVGEVPEEHREEIAQEEAKYGSFLRIPLQDHYDTLSYKTMALWKVVEEQYDAQYVLKVDDDNYVRLDRLAIALDQWTEFGAEYIGCFKIRNVADTRQADPSHRWYDPHHMIFLGDDSRYAEGPFYALRGSIIRGVLRSGLTPRLGGPEDMMVGAIMKGFNITFYDDRRLCHMEGCTEKMIAYKWDHAVRDFMDKTKRFPTLCCLPQNRSLQLPPVDECTNPQKYHEEGLRCLHTLHTDTACATPTLTDGILPVFSYYNYTVNHKWIADRAPEESSWRYMAHHAQRRNAAG
ncbi:hypothetical protein WJX75_004632 [Coccomyxa subellipsoidea]|uniref:Hexosyltransferase n=1 Tax=Coccomyxa subellipsoidea TaxID=248742 RepID=A0ABR2YHS2_9CHLO